MARITQVGPGRKTSGTIDGITYITRGGITYARSAPTMPASAYTTPAAKKRQALFKLIQLHMRFHLRTIRQTFSPKGNGTPSNRYLALNYKALTKALDELADQYCTGEDVTIVEVEAAISTYAAANPKSIVIAHLSGYQDVYLTGEWPATITLNALAGDSTVIIIVNEYGQQTTINADGTVSTGTNEGGSSDSGHTENTENSGSGTNQGTNTGENTGGNTGGGNDSGSGDDDERPGAGN